MQAQVRGRDIGFIPQDPFQALNPVFRIETQLMEQLATHGVAGAGRSDRRAMRAHLVSLLEARAAARRRGGARALSRTSSPAASASAC